MPCDPAEAACWPCAGLARRSARLATCTARARCAPDEVLRANARRLDRSADEARARDEDAPRRAEHRQADREAGADEGPRVRRDAIEQLAPPEEHLFRHLALHGPHRTVGRAWRGAGVRETRAWRVGACLAIQRARVARPSGMLNTSGLRTTRSAEASPRPAPGPPEPGALRTVAAISSLSPSCCGSPRAVPARKAVPRKGSGCSGCRNWHMVRMAGVTAAR